MTPRRQRLLRLSGILAAIILAATAIAGTFARHHRRIFTSQGGNMIVFPGDSLDLAAATFTIDGDTVCRDTFFMLDRSEIRSLTVTRSPANLIEVVTERAATRALDPSELPEEVDITVDGTQVDRAAFTAIPPEAILSMTIIKGLRPRIEVTTTAAASPTE
ncbi:MAG: hypothetical protein NC342_05235 [Pseudoflavonifractor sp.]|nr:hypothetical protein [Alloprevotella sp.]MCM1116920.1 hypothetical protein [Pseudoflavonifractor sp.]